MYKEEHKLLGTLKPKSHNVNTQQLNEFIYKYALNSEYSCTQQIFITKKKSGCRITKA